MTEYLAWNEPDFDDDRQRAISWAKTALEDRFLILDTETTGLDARAEAIQIAVINQDGERAFESLIKPLNPIPSEAIAIHGITNKNVENAPSFLEIYQDLNLILSDKKTLIYNSAFDKKILRQQAIMNNLTPIKFESECVMNWYSQYCGNWNDYHCSYTWQRLPGGDHSAIGDCLATLAVIKEMACDK